MMTILRTIVHEIGGLFVDDGRLAVGTLGCAGAAFLLIRLGLDPALGAVLLPVGLLGLLVENVWRFARRHAKAMQPSP